MSMLHCVTFVTKQLIWYQPRTLKSWG